MIDNVNVILTDLPTKIKAFTSKNEYGDYMIMVNARLDETERRKALNHEVKHIEGEDFGMSRKVSAIENSMS